MSGRSQLGEQAGLIDRAGKFFMEDLWRPGAAGVSALGELPLRALRVIILTLEGFRNDLCLLRASALTYATLMALIPVLALSFAVLRGLGWHGDRLETAILERFTLMSPDAIATVVSYVDNTNLAALGAVGGLVLLLTAVSVLSNIEHSFNAIWGSRPRRNWLRKATDYVALLVTGPLVLATASSLSAAVQSNALVEHMRQLWGVGAALEQSLAIGAHAMVWVLLAGLYLIVPNTKVRLVPALIGGVVAGSVWLATQQAYIELQLGMARYNAIYGAMAQLPILLVWVYASWVIVLAGAELVVAVQNLHAYSHEKRWLVRGRALSEYLALNVLTEVARAAHARTPAPTVEDLAERLAAPVRVVRGLVDELRSIGVLHFGGENQDLCFLSLAPSRVEVSTVLDELSGTAELGDHRSRRADEPPGVAAVVEEVAGARRAVLLGKTLADLVAEAEAETEPFSEFSDDDK